MTPFNYVLLAIAAAVLLYQLNMFRRIRRDVIFPGKPPNRKAVGAVMAVLFLAALIRVQGQSSGYAVLGVLALICVMVLLSGCGLGENGMYSSGTFISYERATYFEIVDGPNGTRNFRLSRLTREGHMLFDPKLEPDILALMERKGIPTFSAYRTRNAQRVEARMNAQQKKKKKKKK